MSITNPVLIELMNENNWTKNEVLSAFRSYTILNKLKEEINSYAGLYLKREDAKLVIDRFNRECLKTKIWIGTTAIKQSDLHL